MSAALNTRPDTSLLNQSFGSIPADISLGSLGSGISTPGRPSNPRIPSTSTATSSAPLSTPSPPTTSAATPYSRKKTDEGNNSTTTPVRRYGISSHRGDEEDGENGQGDLLNTPGEG